MKPRFVVTEIEGHRLPGVGRNNMPVGLSTHVIDTAVNHRLIATYRSEEHGGNGDRAARRQRVRDLARERANRLNRELR